MFKTFFRCNCNRSIFKKKFKLIHKNIVININHCVNVNVHQLHDDLGEPALNMVIQI